MKQPSDYVEKGIIVALVLHDGIDNSMTIPTNDPAYYVSADLGISLKDLKYKRDYYYGGILAIADKLIKCVGFSHWYFISGGSAKDKSPVWRWEYSYTIREKFRVGRKGILKKIREQS